jgi:hypothetical protein
MTPRTSDALPTHVTVNAVLMFVMCGVHALVLLSLAMQALGVVPRHSLENVPSANDAMRAGEEFGRLFANVMMTLWGLAGLVLAPIAGVGLLQRAPWSRTAGLAYWGLNVLSCCCAPVALYGFYSLTRPEVREALDSPR